MTRVYEMEHIFQVIISSKIEDSYNFSFKVTHIFKQKDILGQGISKKTKLNPFSSPKNIDIYYSIKTQK